MKLSDAIAFDLRKYFRYDELFSEIESGRYIAERKLNEGLIITHELPKTIRIIEKNGFDVVLFDDHKFANRFFVELDSDKSDFDKLFKICNNLGWFCSQIRGRATYGPDSVKYTGANLKKHRDLYEKVMLLFEPKYDLPVSTNDVDYLYHFTTKLNWRRIKVQGLSPRTTSKVSTHPDRVYLALTLSACEKFGKRIENKVFDPIEPEHKHSDEINVGVILRIRVDRIPDYFKIYADPNFYKDGCYTLNTIPPTAIEIFKEI